MPRPPRNNKKQKMRKATVKTGQYTPTRTTFTRVPGLVVADTTTVMLRYKDTTLSRLNAGGAQFAVFQLRMNDAYDPDPALGSGSLTGFAQWAAFYQNFRVKSCTITWNLGNFTAAPIYAYMYFTQSNVVPSTVTGAIDLGETPFATPVRILAPAGSYPNVQTFRRKIMIHEVLGNIREYYSNPDFAGTATASPSSPLSRFYVQFIAYSSVTWSSALNSNLTVDYEVEFFGRYPLVA